MSALDYFQGRDTAPESSYRSGVVIIDDKSEDILLEEDRSRFLADLLAGTQKGGTFVAGRFDNDRT